MDDDGKNGIKSNDQEAKKQFFEELKNKNMEERKKLEELKKKNNQVKKTNLEKKVDESTKTDKLKFKDKKEVKKDEKEIKREGENGSVKSNKKDDFSQKSKDKKPRRIFNGRLKGSIIDTIMTSLVSVICLYLFDLVLRLIFGYYISDMKGMFIIIFMIVLVFYPFVMSKTKYKCTLGEKFVK